MVGESGPKSESLTSMLGEGKGLEGAASSWLQRGISSVKTKFKSQVGSEFSTAGQRLANPIQPIAEVLVDANSLPSHMICHHC